MNLKVLLTAFFLIGGLALVAVSDAEAARFGGGRSFGSKPSMQRSMPAPAQRNPAAVAPATAAAAQKPGLFGAMGGMGGMLGGLLAGTLIGSLLMGGGFQGGGLMDMLLMGLLLYVAFKLFARFRASRPATAGGPDADQGQERPEAMRRQSQSAWDTLRGSAAPTAPVGPSVPAGFDAEDFLKGAKMAFTRLQASWDKRDLDDIAQFAGDAVMREIRTQFETDPAPGQTDVLLVNAQLLGVTEEQGRQTATVFFDALLREAPGTDTTQAREVWHFVRPVAGGSWKLDGIQQVE